MPKIDLPTLRDEALKLLPELLGGEFVVEDVDDPQIDAVVRYGRYTLFLAIVKNASLSSLTMVVQRWKSRPRGGQWILVVPYMTRNGADLCAAANIPWFDLAGNAEIRLPQLRVHIRGQRPKIAPRKRESAFAPTASRIVRLLLCEPTRAFTQKELVSESRLAQGFVSNILRDLLLQSLITKEKRTIRVRDPNLLLRAWQEQYRFDKHEIIRGHLSARNGEALLNTASAMLAQQQIEHAATGLAGAWLLSHFAMFRLTTLYVSQRPDFAAWQSLGFREQEAGANLWLVVPNDEGVFAHATRPDEMPCVSPLQVYLDLATQPERASEAAERLREEHLKWITPHA
ncbi:MAG TPA: hypothetical protein VL096_16240 [Pirellulaceae bacterium]|nr:hypothetical protein [Pirellulaceae bacterium]